MTTGDGVPATRVLHVVVGHGLPRYFLNAVRSVRDSVPRDEVLVIDNASPDRSLRQQLVRMAEADGHMDVVLRNVNDIRLNGKVGSLYAAYEVAFAYALDREFDLIHLIQGDFQMLWWDADVVKKSMDLFGAHERCVNIQTVLLSRDKLLTDEIGESSTPGVFKLLRYGLNDTGVYHLARWRALGMKFDEDEDIHARRYLDEGMEVLCHPWPTDAPIPWPAVIRAGRPIGREVSTGKLYLLRPVSVEGIAELKRPGQRTWLEDICIPWGWLCLTPMHTTSVDSIDYWVFRYRDAKRNGPSRVFPRLEKRGVSWRQLACSRPPFQHRPPLAQLFVAVPCRELWRRVLSRAKSLLRGSARSVR